MKFSGKIICGCCGGVFGSKVWHSNQAERKSVWVCNNRWGNEVHCKAPHVNDGDLQEMFCRTVSAFMAAHPDLHNGLICALEQTIKSRKKYGEKENRLVAMRSVIERSERKFSEEACYVLLERCTVKKGETVLRLIDGSEYYGKLVGEYKAKNAEFDQLQSEIADKKAREVQIQNFIRRVRELDTFVTEFDKGLWSDTVEYMTVYSKEKVVVTIKDGTEI